MLKVGIAGIGFMGWIHWLAWKRIPGVQIAAIATVEPERRAGDWTAIRGNFGPPGEKVDLGGIAVFETAAEMVREAADVDLVDICLPTPHHVPAALAGFQAGKHVLCEKPLALTLADCDRVLAAAGSGGRQFFVAHVLPFFPEYAWAIGEVRSGRWGRLLGGHFKRVISDPHWLRGFYDPAVIGGPLLDLHVHDAHLIRLLFGKPVGVQSRGRMRGETTEYASTIFDFADRSLVVSSSMGVVHQQGRPFTHGFEIHLEQATIHHESAAFADGGETMPVKLLRPDGTVLRPDIPAGDPLHGFAAELTEVRDCAVANRPSPTLSGILARDAVELCELQAAAIRQHLGNDRH